MSDSFNGKPQATIATRIPVACGLPLNKECVTNHEAEYNRSVLPASLDEIS